MGDEALPRRHRPCPGHLQGDSFIDVRHETAQAERGQANVFVVMQARPSVVEVEPHYTG